MPAFIDSDATVIESRVRENPLLVRHLKVVMSGMNSQKRPELLCVLFVTHSERFPYPDSKTFGSVILNEKTGRWENQV